jgi:hypothetical protein
MPTGNAQETRITDWLASREGDMIALLEKLVNTDSGSYDKAGVDAVRRTIAGSICAATSSTGCGSGPGRPLRRLAKDRCIDVFRYSPSSSLDAAKTFNASMK